MSSKYETPEDFVGNIYFLSSIVSGINKKIMITECDSKYIEYTFEPYWVLYFYCLDNSGIGYFLLDKQENNFFMQNKSSMVHGKFEKTSTSSSTFTMVFQEIE